MYQRAILCTFQISVNFYYVPVGGRGGRGGLEKGGGTRERGIESILYRYSKYSTVLSGTVKIRPKQLSP